MMQLLSRVRPTAAALEDRAVQRQALILLMDARDGSDAGSAEPPAARRARLEGWPASGFANPCFRENTEGRAGSPLDRDP
ncbi:MAG: hypothetical protein ABI895_14315 [Deltaproteobacteria bacterium]